MRVSFLLSLFWSLWSLIVYFPGIILRQRRARLEQKPECHILQMLSPEIIAGFLGYLPNLDKIVLAQTCSQFRIILHDWGYVPASELSSLQHTDYLSRISRDDLNAWACEWCHQLHKFHPRDIIRATRFQSCHGRVDISEQMLPFHTFWPGHRHVQLALKLSRQEQLGPQQRTYLARLMRGVQAFPLSSIRRPSLRLSHETYPLVVQGRYLLKAVRYYEDAEWTSSKLFMHGNAVTTFSACTHQELFDDDLVSGWRHTRRREHQAYRAIYPKLFPILPNEEIETALETAWRHRGRVVEGSCPQCPTDFTVQMWETSVVLCIWSDLGGETTINDEVWHVYGISAPRLSTPYWSKAMYHEPGGVKRRYESTE